MGITTYFQGVAAEVRKVSWPTFPTALRNFLAVVVGVALATALVAVLDIAFIKLLGVII
jgi:preprotein translocase SecE subunit